MDKPFTDLDFLLDFDAGRPDVSVRKKEVAPSPHVTVFDWGESTRVWKVGRIQMVLKESKRPKSHRRRPSL